MEEFWVECPVEMVKCEGLYVMSRALTTTIDFCILAVAGLICTAFRHLYMYDGFFCCYCVVLVWGSHFYGVPGS